MLNKACQTWWLNPNDLSRSCLVLEVEKKRTSFAEVQLDSASPSAFVVIEVTCV